jgi:transposase
VRAAHPRARVEGWAHDQARRGLKPIVRRVWARRGQRPVAISTHGYEWSYVYGFVHPSEGRPQWCLLPEVNTEAMQLARNEFVRAERIGPRKHVVLVVDGAPWHRSPKLQLPAGLHFVHLPPCTPELQPAERLWPLINEGMANRPFATIQGLDRALGDRCRHLLQQAGRVHALTQYHWWPEG